MRPYTAGGDPRGEARVAADLQRIADAVRHASPGDDLAAIVLLGGYARGEGTVVAGADGMVRGFNDYDLLIVFEKEPSDRERFRELSRGLAEELEIDFVDLGLVARGALAEAPATLFWYELGEAHRILWSRPGLDLRLPRFSPEALEPEESSRLLLNRGMALLWAALMLWPEETPGSESLVADAATLRFCSIAAHKAVLAAGDAALLRAGIYTPSQELRGERLGRRGDLLDWAPPGFLGAYARAAAFRRDPRVGKAAEVVSLWRASWAFHEAGFRASETARLGRGFEGWDDHARLARGNAITRNVGSPRRAIRTLRRGLLEGIWLPVEEKLFALMPSLLYVGPRAGGEAWRRGALEAIREWHP